MLGLAESVIDANSEIDNDKDYTDILNLLNSIPVPLKGTDTSPEFTKYLNPNKQPAVAKNSPIDNPIGELDDDYEY